MIIAIKTDTSVAELVLVRAANDGNSYWHADRNLARDLHWRSAMSFAAPCRNVARSHGCRCL